MNKDNEFEQPFIKGVIDRLEGDLAVVKLTSGAELNWPVSELPKGVSAGSAVRLVLSPDESEQKVREQLAKTILNQILKGNKDII